jgi:hypothetical protein
MLIRHSIRILLVAFGLLGIVLNTVPAGATASASAHLPPPLPISGPITRIASPQAYNSPDVVSFDVAQSLSDLFQIQYVVVTGKLVNGQYEFPHQLELKPGAGFPGVAAIEVATNPRAHTQLLAVGFLDAAGLAKRHSSQTSPQPAAGGRPGSSALFMRPALSYDNEQVNHTTAWYDPVNIELTQDVDWVNYDFGPLNAGAYSAYNLTWQDTATGWYVVSNWGSTGVGPSTITHSSNVHFRNVPFCSYLETNVYDNGNWVTLNKRSRAVSGGINNTYATGTCSFLLHEADWIEIYEQSG